MPGTWVHVRHMSKGVTRCCRSTARRAHRPRRGVGPAATLAARRDEIAALPGVTVVGIGGTLPLRNTNSFTLVQAKGKPPAPGESGQANDGIRLTRGAIF